MEINISEFVNDYKRMCSSFSVCAECELNTLIEQEKISNCHDIEDIAEIVPVVQKWVMERPIKTYLSAFKEKFPNANTDKDFYSCMCVGRIYGTEHKCKDCHTETCEKCWNREFKTKG